jgi:hypothetical protein
MFKRPDVNDSRWITHEPTSLSGNEIIGQCLNIEVGMWIKLRNGEILLVGDVNMELGEECDQTCDHVYDGRSNNSPREIVAYISSEIA